MKRITTTLILTLVAALFWAPHSAATNPISACDRLESNKRQVQSGLKEDRLRISEAQRGIAPIIVEMDKFLADDLLGTGNLDDPEWWQTVWEPAFARALQLEVKRQALINRIDRIEDRIEDKRVRIERINRRLAKLC